MTDDLSTRPRNNLGEPATRTPDEAIARLREKVTKNRGGANRERIQAQIAEELTPLHAGATSRGLETRPRHDGSVM
jgi:hypothetical protein